MSDQVKTQVTGEPGVPPAPADQSSGYVTEAAFAGFKNDMFGAMRGMIADGFKQLANGQNSPTPTPSAPGPAPQPEPKPAASQNESVEARLERIELENSFFRHSANHQLTPGQRDTMSRLFIADRPANPSEWIAKEMGNLGIGGGQPGNPNPHVQQPTPPAQRPSPQPAGSPAPTAAGTPPTDLLDYTNEDMAHEFNMKAPHPENHLDVRNKPYYQDIQGRMKRSLARKKVILREPHAPRRYRYQ